MLRTTLYSCDACCRSKCPWYQPYGLVQTLLVLDGPWKFVSLDFIIEFPSSKRFDIILNIVDWLTNMTHFLPYINNTNSRETTYLVMHEVFISAS